jgi:hypothetical protein
MIAASTKSELLGAQRSSEPTQKRKPEYCCDPNNCQNNSERNKTDWPVRRDFPKFAV